jgi:hypothetical protein
MELVNTKKNKVTYIIHCKIVYDKYNEAVIQYKCKNIKTIGYFTMLWVIQYVQEY